MHTLYKRLMDTVPGRCFQATTYRYYTLPFVVWVIIMMILSSIPGSGIPEISIIQWDKIAHFTEFTVFTILLGRYLHFKKKTSVLKSVVLILLIGITYSILDELHQLFIPFRDCSLQDLAADILGVFTGVAGFRFIAIKDLIPAAEKERIS